MRKLCFQLKYMTMTITWHVISHWGLMPLLFFHTRIWIFVHRRSSSSLMWAVSRLCICMILCVGQHVYVGERSVGKKCMCVFWWGTTCLWCVLNSTCHGHSPGGQSSPLTTRVSPTDSGRITSSITSSTSSSKGKNKVGLMVVLTMLSTVAVGVL